MRECYLKVRLSDGERATLTKAAAERGMSLSAWARHMLCAEAAHSSAPAPALEPTKFDIIKAIAAEKGWPIVDVPLLADAEPRDFAGYITPDIHPRSVDLYGREMTYAEFAAAEDELNNTLEGNDEVPT